MIQVEYGSVMKPLRGWYLHLTIARKISVSVNAVFVSVLVLVTVVLGVKTYRRAYDERVRVAVQNVRMVREKIELIAENVDNYAKLAITNRDVQAVVRAVVQDGVQPDYTLRSRVRSPLNSVIYPRSIIDAIVISDLVGNQYGSGYLSGVDPISARTVARVLADRGRPVWRSTQVSGYVSSRYNRQVPVLGLMRGIYDTESGRPLGVVRVYVAERQIADTFREVSLGRGSLVALLNPSGTIAATGEQALLFDRIADGRVIAALTDAGTPRAVAEARIGRKTDVVIGERFGSPAWWVVGIVPVATVRADIAPLVTWYGVAGIIAAVVAALLARWIARTVTRPLHELAQTMQDVAEGDLETRCETNTHDEIGRLATEFNQMLERMSGLMDEVRREHAEHLQAELTALQTRIDPHFLYNALASVSSLMQSQRLERARDFVGSLSRFYRGVFGRDRMIVSLEDELALCRSYLEVLTVRFDDTLTFDITGPSGETVEDRTSGARDSGAPTDADDRWKPRILIPHMTIQPLVENAVRHGIWPAAHGGWCGVSAHVGPARLTVTVADNGIGMSTEACRGLPSHRGGVRNVYERLRLYYGDAVTLTCNSDPGRGTVITIGIPLEATEHVSRADRR